MPSVVVRPRTLVDLAEIWAFIAEDSVKQADRFAGLIDSQFRALARQPHMGRSRPELATEVPQLPGWPARHLLSAASQGSRDRPGSARRAGHRIGRAR